MPTAFGDIYAKLCERYPDPRERGRQFEPLVAQVLRTDSQFRNRFRTVWHWNEWPGHDGASLHYPFTMRGGATGRAGLEPGRTPDRRLASRPCCENSRTLTRFSRRSRSIGSWSW